MLWRLLTSQQPDAIESPPGTRRLPNARFHGYACYDDCADHRAAYAWAAREGVTDPAQRRHISRAFREGCTAWTRDGAKSPGGRQP